MSTNSTLKLTLDQTQLLQQMFGDLASLDYDDKYNDDFGSDVFNQLWDKVTKMWSSPLFLVHLLTFIMLQFMTIVLDNFCNCNGLEMASADDLLYDADNQLSKYQKQWLTQYIKVWDVIINEED